MNPTIREVSAIALASAERWYAQPREAMISIIGTDEPTVRLKKGWAHVLRLRFDDIETTSLRRRVFTEEDADKVIDFLDNIETKIDHVVVHCTHGLSRSPAIARYISQRYGLSNGFGNHMTFNRHVFSTLFLRWRHRVAPGQGGCCNMGYARADDPIYRMGPIVSGRPLFAPPPKGGGPGTFIDLGSLPLDHPIYRSGPIVSGRRLFEGPPKKKGGGA